MIIGITGNSGTGKSEISKLLAEKIDAKIINADEVVKELSEKGNEYYEKIVKLFGSSILNNNKLNKPQMAKIIYNNKEKREKLNKLTYKYVVEEIKKRAKNSEYKNLIIDAPLLFESGLNKICNITIGVIANIDNKIQRICKRDNIDEETALARLKIQQEDRFYIQKSDYIIKNNGKINEINLEVFMNIANVNSIKKVDDVTKDKNKVAIKIIKGSIISIVITAILLCIYAAVLSFTTVSETTMQPVIIVITGVSILIGSSISSINIKKQGMINGGIVGLIYMLILYIVSSLVSMRFELNVHSIIMLITGIVAGMLGGIIGVNLK